MKVPYLKKIEWNIRYKISSDICKGLEELHIKKYKS